MSNIPATPVLCPHFGFVLLVRSEVFTVVSIAGVNLLREDMQGSLVNLPMKKTEMGG